MKWLWMLLLLIPLTGIGWWWMSTHAPQEQGITTFEECVAEGNPVMESYPRQCRSKAGDLFVEDVSVAPSTHPLITVATPLPQSLVGSPVTVTGEARGYWFFEASFPITVTDAAGTVLGTGYATAGDSWMTEDFVPFTGTVTFTATTDSGFIIFHKDNPSGLPENDDSFSVPVRFSATPMKTVRVYLYDSRKDLDQNGSILCSAKGLVAVERQIPVSQTPLTDTIRLLVERGATAPEKQAGQTSEFPLPGFTLVSASISKGVATLTFDDPQNKTQGGACRVGILRAQIEGTAKQFPGVSSVIIKPNTLFQP